MDADQVIFGLSLYHCQLSHAHALSRLGTLRSWQQRTRKLMPIVMAVLGGAKFFDKESTDQETII